MSRQSALQIKLLMNCQGIESRQVDIQPTYWNSNAGHRLEFHVIGDVVVPDNIHIEITGTPTKGTIGKLVDIDFGAYKRHGSTRVSEYDMTYIIQVEGRATTNRIVHYQADILENFTGPTVYKRNVNKKSAVELPLLVNKYNQPLEPGRWAAGIGPHKTLFFGQITRYSKASIWVNPTPSIEKSKENCINNPKETVILPDGTDYEQTVTMMVLSGWRR